jgi:hypothetical protein
VGRAIVCAESKAPADGPVQRGNVVRPAQKVCKKTVPSEWAPKKIVVELKPADFILPSEVENKDPVEDGAACGLP